VNYRKIEPDHKAVYDRPKPEVLSEDMTVADLVDVLAALRFYDEAATWSASTAASQITYSARSSRDDASCWRLPCCAYGFSDS
jgi:hypothetical protein